LGFGGEAGTAKPRLEQSANHVGQNFNPCQALAVGNKAEHCPQNNLVFSAVF
jgi:hypothetical protein